MPVDDIKKVFRECLFTVILFKLFLELVCFYQYFLNLLCCSYMEHVARFDRAEVSIIRWILCIYTERKEENCSTQKCLVWD